MQEAVAVSYMEWVQNLNNHYWELEAVRKELEKIMVAAYKQVSATANEHHISMRLAAFTCRDSAHRPRHHTAWHVTNEESINIKSAV